MNTISGKIIFHFLQRWILPLLFIQIACTSEPPKTETHPPKYFDSGSGKLIQGLAFSSDGKYIFAGGQNKKILMFDRDNGSVIWESPERPDAVLSLAVSPDGRLLAQTCGDNTMNSAELNVWDIAEKKILWSKANLTNDVQFVRFSPDGKTLAVAHYFNILFYEPLTGQQKKFFSGHPMDVNAIYGHVDAITDIEFTQDPLKFITVGWDKNVKIWDIDMGHEIKTYPEGDPINALVLIDNGRRIVTGSRGGVHVWNRETNLCDTILTLESDVQAMELLRQGSYIITGDDKGSLTVWKTEGLVKITTVPQAHQRGIWALAAAPDGEFLASAGGDGKVILWHAEYLIRYRDAKDSVQTASPATKN